LKSYRYGFNGKENDNEVKGEGNQQDYGMRVYDPRLGKFLSVDPLAPKFPELTPYQFAHNSPIDGVDLDGRERLDFRLTFENEKPKLEFISSGIKEKKGIPDFWNVTKIPPYIRLEYNGEHYIFADGRNLKGTNWGIIREDAGLFVDLYNMKDFNSFVANPNPDKFQSQEEGHKGLIRDLTVRSAIGLVGEITNRSIGASAKIQWRGRYTSEQLPEYIYRFDERTPEQIKAAGGFKSWGTNLSLDDHVDGRSIRDKTSAYIGASTSTKALVEWIDGYGEGYIYKISTPSNALNINRIYGKKYEWSWEREIVVPLKIPYNRIVSHNYVKSE
jgi:RHS repeat-associated protein